MREQLLTLTVRPACVRVTFPSRAVCSPDMFLEARFLCKILPARVTPVRSYHLKVLGFRTKGYPVCTGITPVCVVMAFHLCVCVCDVCVWVCVCVYKCVLFSNLSSNIHHYDY